MQILLIRGPVDQIHKIHLGLYSVLRIGAVLLSFIVLAFFINQWIEHRQPVETQIIDISMEPGSKEDYVKFVKQIQLQLAENKKKLKDLEELNKKLLKLNVPEYALENNPNLKNRLFQKSKPQDSFGGPFVKVSNQSNDLKDVFQNYLALIDVSNQQLNAQHAQWVEELSWLSSQPIAYPIKENVSLSSGFGVRLDPFNNAQSMHTGLDFAAPIGTTIYATAAGIVRQAGWNGSYGLSIEIDHGNGLMSRYAHTSQLLISQGMKVEQNQPIGKVGSTGRSTGPHLHYEILKDNQFVNPTLMLARMSQASLP